MSPVTKPVFPLVLECSANRGRSYRVSFGNRGETQRVESKCYGPHGHYWRTLWFIGNGPNNNEMSITAACAVRAALQKLNPPVWEQPSAEAS